MSEVPGLLLGGDVHYADREKILNAAKIALTVYEREACSTHCPPCGIICWQNEAQKEQNSSFHLN